MTSNELRQRFLDFFARKGHTIVPSSSLIPGNDPTLLFTNAGMVQFKDVFLGLEQRPYVRAASSQRCVRAGGKHNDLENVGYTARHHTFFEMLGNFSFGDYFKHDAIHYAWEFLTQDLKLPPGKLWVSVYAEDEEAYGIWVNEIGIPVDRVVRIGDNRGARYASDNFWQMGDTGPCGPCTEIFYDHGPGIPGGPPGSPDEDGDRYIEIWNNVFMQFNRDEAGVMHPLPKPSVDTGMGLERISAVLQHVHSNYEIDLFQALIKAAARETFASPNNVKHVNATFADIERDWHEIMQNSSLRVIADHIRACSFLVVDGVIPDKDGRGYVLRRIIRRAIRHGYKLGMRSAFFYKIVPELVIQMGKAYPELVAAQNRIMAILKQEEDRFFETIGKGMEILVSAIFSKKENVEQSYKVDVLNGDIAFLLHDTYGFPLDLTQDVCREYGITVDVSGFNAAMARQKEHARAAGKFKMADALEYSGTPTTFYGYDSLNLDEAIVTALYVDGSPVDKINAGETAVVVLDKTPFYAESGGQVGDKGILEADGIRFDVTDTQKIRPDVFGHHGSLGQGTLRVGAKLAARVDGIRRARTMRNHSVTHLMHKALREVLGDHVQQKGSLVDADKTRFDFAHSGPLSAHEIQRVETIVNHEILANTSTRARVVPMDEARKLGAMMLFGEKYGDEVRVVDIGSSRELCGGTHVARTGDIGLFKIVMEGGVAAGIRRVEAITGDNALAYLQNLDSQIKQVAAALKAQPSELPQKIAQTQDQIKALEKELDRLKSRLATSQGDSMASQAIEVAGVKILSLKLEGADAKALRETADKLREKLKSCVLVLGTTQGGKVSLIAAVTPELTGKIKAGDLVNYVALQVGGKGGGKPDLAQAGGTQPEHLSAALEGVKSWVAERLSS